MSIKTKANRLKSDIPAVFLALKAKETPWYAKVCAAITVAYALSPVDLVPDFIPVLGYLDDVILLPLLVALTVKFIPKETFQKYREKAEGMWENGKPKKWYFAIPIIIVWTFLALLLLSIFF